MSGTNPPSSPTRGTDRRCQAGCTCGKHSPRRRQPKSLLLTPDEAARLLGIARRSLYRLAAAGHIRMLKLNRRAARVERAEIDNYLERLREAAARESTTEVA